MDLFKASVQTWPEVVECASLTGEMDYLLRVVVSDMQHYSRFDYVDNAAQAPQRVGLQDQLCAGPCQGHYGNSAVTAAPTEGAAWQRKQGRCRGRDPGKPCGNVATGRRNVLIYVAMQQFVQAGTFPGHRLVNVPEGRALNGKSGEVS